MRVVCAVLAAAAAIAMAAAAAIDLARGGWYVGWLAIGPLPFYAVGLAGFLRRPDNLPVRWLLAAGSAFALDSCIGDVFLPLAADSWDPVWVAALAMSRQWASMGSSFASLGFVALFPSGRPRTVAERWVLWVAGAEAAVLPLLNALSSPTLSPGLFAGGDEPAAPSGVVLASLTWLGPLTDALYRLYPLWVVVALALLAVRYRRSPSVERRRIRWLLMAWVSALAAWVPLLFLAWFTGTDSTLVRVASWVLWPLTVVLTVGAVLVALFHDGVLGIDEPARRRLASRVLRLLVALGTATVAVGLGLLAGRAGGTAAGVLTTAAAMAALRPVWRRLEHAVDRAVFGARLDGYDMLARFGASLERSRDAGTLAAELADALHSGLDLTWVTVSLDGAVAASATAGSPEGHPAATVPVEQSGERHGQITCGLRRDGPLLAEDRRLLALVAAQAAAAASTLQLTAELGARVDVIRRQAAELAASRDRVVQGQDAERRRIQRDLHDGVQQEVVALSAKVSLAQQRLRRGDPAVAATLDELQRDLRGVLADVREFAYAIHPPVLADRGLVEAVEAQASRLAVPTSVRADPGLRGTRFPAPIEAAAWYALSEAMSNVAKHARASTAEVTVHRVDGLLALSVRDDGCGFDPAGPRGLGLTGLTDRLDTVGGRVDLRTAPGHGTLLCLHIPLPDEATRG